MRHPDVQSHPSDEEIREQREEDRRKAQAKLMEEPYVYHQVETRPYYDENLESQTDRVLLDTVDIRNLEDRPHQLLRVVSNDIPDSEFNASEIDEVPEDYQNESGMNMTARLLVHNLTLGGDDE